jgi:hypothetical protein
VNGRLNETFPSVVLALRPTVSWTPEAPLTIGKLKCFSVPTTKFVFSGTLVVVVGVKPRPDCWVPTAGDPKCTCVAAVPGGHTGAPGCPQKLTPAAAPATCENVPLTASPVAGGVSAVAAGTATIAAASASSAKKPLKIPPSSIDVPPERFYRAWTTTVKRRICYNAT